MKKLLFAFGLLFVSSLAKADSPSEWNYIPITSYTEVATPGPVMFTSATIQFVGVSISSPAPGSSLVIFRSTSAVWTSDISTQTSFSTSYLDLNNAPSFIPLFEMKNTSYTYINKIGTAKITLWFRCPKRRDTEPGLCPGLGYFGK